MKKILILNVPDLESNIYKSRMGFTVPKMALYQSSITIIKSPTHFRCIKNRWREPDDEKIPNYLLKSYLMFYKGYFTTEDIIESLL